MWRRAGEELITHRQAGEQQTDAMRARLSSAQPGWREERRSGAEGKEKERPRWREMEGKRGTGRKEEWEKGREGERELESSRGGYCKGGE